VRGDWWIQWHCALGHKHRESVGPKSVAEHEVTKRRTQARTEGFCLSETKRNRPVLFSDIVDDYVQYQKAHNRPPHNDCVRILFWKDRWGDRPVTAITRQDVEQGKLALSERRDPQRTPKRHPNKRAYLPATVNRFLAALRGCLNLAIRNGKTTSNPVVGTRFLRENNGRLKYIPSPEAERVLLDAMPDARRREMVVLAMHTGLRWSEQMGLRWRDCDFLTGTLAVPRSKHGGARHVPMNSRVREILMDMATRRLPQGGEHVFRGADGQEPPQKADRWFPRTVAKARHVLTEMGRPADAEMLDGFTWHCLRHTFASRLAMAGVDLLVIKDLGGWKTLAMVLRYAHLMPGRLREGVERLVTTSSAGQNPAGTDTGSDTKAVALETTAV
jgi:integrase